MEEGGLDPVEDFPDDPARLTDLFVADEQGRGDPHGRFAVQEPVDHDPLLNAQPAGGLHLLEPVQKLVLVTPASSTSRVSSAVASRRGQMLGMGPRDGWTGWDRIEALIPESELDGLEAELRSLSQGLASYEAEFDHLAELNGHLADKVVQQNVAEPA